MKIILIPNPNLKTEHNKVTPDTYVPLGLLSLATILRNDGYDVEILDINKLSSDSSYSEIPDVIMSKDPDIVGFSTMCNQYPTTIRMARSCKVIKSDLQIMFGGPEATITDRATLEAFPFIDIIVRGECEQSITQIVKELPNKDAFYKMPGVTFRDGKEIIRTPSLSPIDDLNQLPLPDYGLFPDLNTLKEIPLEVGRGCPFECTFCSTKNFWQRNFRLRSIENLILLIKKLSLEFGFKKFSFQHDNMTVSQERVFELCDALEKESLEISWTCSSRIDCLNNKLLKRMARAGCTKIFIGIETGSPRMQKLIKKNLNLKHAVETVRQITDAKMSFTASFIMGFPEEKMDDLVQTICLMMKLKFEGDGNEVTQFHMLAPTPGTTLYNKYRNNLLFDNNFSDMVITELTDNELEMVKRYSDIFSAFYYYQTPYLDRNILLKINYLFINILQLLPYTSYVLWKDKKFDFPRFLIEQFSTLKMPITSWARITDTENLTNISCFLKNVLNKFGFEDHFIHDIIKYEVTANKVAQYNMKNAKSLIETFNYDVEGLIEKISHKKLSDLSEIINNDKYYLLFTKKDSKVFTIRLHSKFTKLLSQFSQGYEE